MKVHFLVNDNQPLITLILIAMAMSYKWCFTFFRCFYFSPISSILHASIFSLSFSILIANLKHLDICFHISVDWKRKKRRWKQKRQIWKKRIENASLNFKRSRSANQMAREVDNLWMSVIAFKHIRDVYAPKSLDSTKKCQNKLYKCLIYTIILFSKCTHKIFLLFHKRYICFNWYMF